MNALVEGSRIADLTSTCTWGTTSRSKSKSLLTERAGDNGGSSGTRELLVGAVGDGWSVDTLVESAGLHTGVVAYNEDISLRA